MTDHQPQDSGDVGFSGYFEQLFGKGSVGRASKGDDIEQPVKLTLQEAYTGSARTLNIIQSMEICPTCKGTRIVADKVCPTCSGQGSLPRNKRIRVNIPAGVDNGSKIRVAGQGQPGINDGPRGDIFLVITVEPDLLFERKGDDLWTEIEVKQTTAQLGGEIIVPVPDGRRLVLILPPETPDGRVFRLRDKGIPYMNGGGNGHLYARVKVNQGIKVFFLLCP